jgi:hypothetical protein
VETAADSDGFLRDFPCPNCAVKGKVVWDAVSGTYVCRHCRVGGIDVSGRNDGRPVRIKVRTKEETPSALVEVHDGYWVREGAKTRRVAVTYHVPVEKHPPALRDPRSPEWQETWGQFMKEALSPVVAAERRVERDRLRRQGKTAPRRSKP